MVRIAALSGLMSMIGSQRNLTAVRTEREREGERGEESFIIIS